MADTRRGVWVALERCGCIRGVASDQANTLDSRREWFDDGLSVLYVTWATWETDYRQRFTLTDCPHQKAEAVR
jgi:hypothetical protein